MLSFYSKISNQNERNRIEKIDFLDELEEWNLLMSHYFLLLAYKTKNSN